MSEAFRTQVQFVMCVPCDLSAVTQGLRGDKGEPGSPGLPGFSGPKGPAVSARFKLF